MAKKLIAALALALAAPAAAGPLLTAVAPDKPLPALKPGEAMVVVRYFATGMAGDNRVTFYRLDPATGAIVTGADGKPEGFKATFTYTVFGGAKGAKVPRVLIVPAGRYVMASRTFNGQLTDSFCFGAPRFDLAAGDIAYLGDYEVVAGRKAPDRELRNALVPSSDLAGARADLVKLYPAEAGRLAEWQPTNGTAIPCDGDEFTAYAVPGAAGDPVVPLGAQAPAALKPGAQKH